MGLSVLAAWVFLLAWDVWVEIPFRGEIPMESVPGTSTQRRRPHFQLVDSKVRSIMELTNPGDTILDLTGSPMFHVLSGRLGPGYADIVMPGTFLGDEHELEFLERLKAAPPALVIFPRRPFDDIGARAVQRTAARVSDWVMQNYRQEGLPNKFVLMIPKLPRDPRTGP